MIKKEQKFKSHYSIKTMHEDLDKINQGKEEGTKKSPPPSELPQVPPVKISTPPKPELLKPPESKKSNKKTIITIIIIIALIAIGVYYWQKEKALSEPETPISLIESAETKIIEINPGQETLVFSKIKQEAKESQEIGSFKRILIKKTTSQKKDFVNFSEFSDLLDLNVPKEITDNIKDYTAFLYSQKEGSRMGIVLLIDPSYSPTKDMRNWETTIAEDLRPIYLEEEPQEPANKNFKGVVYSDTAIRYINLPDQSLTMSSAILYNYMVITTSKESTFKAIDELLKKEAKN